MVKSIFNIFKKKPNVSIEIDKNQKKEFIDEVSNKVVDEKKEIILTDDEIQLYIRKEIQNRIPENLRDEFTDYEVDPLLRDAAKIVVEHQLGSTALIQRKLKIGYIRGGTLIDNLESLGIVGQFDGSNGRQVLISNLETLDSYLLSLNIPDNNRFEYFKRDIMPHHEELIQQNVIEQLETIEIEKENELKERLRQEILAKEKDRNDKEKIKKLRNQIKEELIQDGILENLNEINELKREQIPQSILDRVWNRDGGKCTSCGSQEKIEFDHIIPFSKGGANTYRNIQILCEKCNRKKSNNIG